MEYQLFAYTKTARDDWNFHVLPTPLDTTENEEIKDFVVRGLYARFPNLPKLSAIQQNSVVLGASFRYCYFVPLTKAHALILSRVARMADRTSRPFWDFVGAYLPLGLNSFAAIRHGILRLLADDLLFDQAEEFIDRSGYAPKPARKSEYYAVGLDGAESFEGDVSERKPISDSIQLANIPVDAPQFFEGSGRDFPRLTQFLDDPTKPLFYFSFGPVDQQMFLENVISLTQRAVQPQPGLSTHQSLASAAEPRRPARKPLRLRKKTISRLVRSFDRFLKLAGKVLRSPKDR